MLLKSSDAAIAPTKIHALFVMGLQALLTLGMQVENVQN